MSKSTDERGRIYLPKDVRERFGDKYRIVELPSHVALFPVDDHPSMESVQPLATPSKDRTLSN